MFEEKSRGLLAALVTVGISVGCGGYRKDAGAAGGPNGPSPTTVPKKIGYPPGRWRLASAAEMSRAIVWMSHIVVMHHESRPKESGLRPGKWSPDAAQDRSREVAYAIALKAQAEAQADPNAFPDIVRKYSEDVVTRARGGSLGGVHANQLAPALLDAVAALRPGQVSEVVETPMGFHVLLLRQAPPEQAVSGARIVVGYHSTVGTSPDRTRADALQRATALVQKARAGADFGELARTESDNDDRLRGGAMGAWSTHESRFDNTTAIEVLAELPDGAVSEPLDSPAGFQVLKRISAGPVEQLAARTVKVPIVAAFTTTGMHPLGSPEAEEARAVGQALAKKEAEAVAALLRRNPDAFEAVTKERCCRTPERWVSGHGDPMLTSAVEKLRIGEVAATPMLNPGFYLVAQRLDPDLFGPTEHPILGLPSPATADLEEVIGASSSAGLAAELGKLTAAANSLGLEKSEQSLLVRELDAFRSVLGTALTREARVTAYRDRLNTIHRGLSESAYARVVSMLEIWASSRILTLSNPVG